MKVIGHKSLKISSLRLPGEFKRRVESPEVDLRAKSIQRLGLIQDPVVRMPGKVLLVGQDRVAAHVKLGLAEVECKLVECTDDEAEEVRWAENIERRHDPKERDTLVAARAEKLRRQIEAEDRLRKAKEEAEEALEDAKGPVGHIPKRRPTDKPVGRPKSSKTRALEQLAAERGVAPDSVRKSLDRAKAKKVKDKKADIEQTPEDEVVKAELHDFSDLGIMLDNEWLAKVAAIQLHVESAATSMNNVLSQLTRMQSADLPFPESVRHQFRQRAHELSQALRLWVPKSLCPYCKGDERVQPHCGQCQAQGWVPGQKLNGVPKELLQEDEPFVYWQGGIVPLEEVSA